MAGDEMVSSARQSSVSPYEEALDSLSSLILRRTRADASNNGDRFDIMVDYLKMLDLEYAVSKLKVIHVAGTKGKGSTCTFTESILRNCGFRTGLFTSPHLIDVRERFQLDGVEISEEKFLSYFWWCWDKLKEKTSEDVPMPTYFRFIALLAFKIFTEEQGALNVLHGSDIEVIVSVPNNQFQEMASNPSFANSWVNKNIRLLWPAVRFRRIVIGNQVIPGPDAQFVLTALQNMGNALARAGLGQIKISTAIHSAVLEESYPPSRGSFSPQAAQHLNFILHFLNGQRSQLLADVYSSLPQVLKSRYAPFPLLLSLVACFMLVIFPISFPFIAERL